MGNHAKHFTTDLEPGDHLCMLYETEKERDSCLIEYFCSGLDKNEKILYITDLHDDRGMLRCLNENGLDIERCIINGQMKTIEYSKDFSYPDEILELMASEAKRALEEGYSALRIAVEMIYSEGLSEFSEYEAKIGDLLPDGCLTLCLYNQSSFDPGAIMEVLRAHPLVMVGTEVCKNLYYIPPGDLQCLGRNRALVDHAKESLLEHRQAEVRAQESEMKLKEIVERSIDAIVMTDRHGRITYASPSFQEMTGLGIEEVLGRPFYEFITKSERKQAMDDLNRLLLGDDNRLKDIQNKVIRKDGSEIFIEANVSAVFRDRNIVGTHCILRDITQEKKIYEALQERERGLRSIIEQSIDGIVLIDEQGAIIEWNRGAEVNFSLDRTAVLGRLIWDVQFQLALSEKRNSEFYAFLKSSMLNLLDTGECPYTKRPSEVTYLRPDGKRCVIQNMAFPIKTNKGFMVCTISRDITKDKEARDALLQSEEKYRLLVDNLNEGIWATDAQANTTFVNNRMAEMLGYSVEEMLGRSLFSFMDEADGRIASCNIERRKQGIKEKHGFEFISKNGSRVYTWMETSPIIDDLGRYTGALAAVADITESKIDEERLSLSEARYRMLFENSPVGIISVDVRGNILEANPVLLGLLGSPSLEATCAINVLTYPPLIRAGFADHFARCMESGEVLTFENLYTSKWGKCSYLKLKLTPIRDASGRITGAQATVEDISDHKHAEKALFENLQFLQRLIDTIPNPVYYHNLKCVFLGCNKAFEKMFSLTRENIIGKSIYDLDLADDLAGEFGEAGLDLLSDPGVQTFESSSAMAEGQTHHVINYRATYTNASGNVAGIVGTILDITERKRIEDERARLISELESRNAEMERFVYTVSHDLRSPLVTISGFMGLLKMDIDKGSLDRVLMDLKMIDDATSRMDKLLRDTLELSRIGRVASPQEAVSMDEIIDEALSQTREKISARGVLISKDEGMPHVYVDRMRIVEAVVNLIENGLKYMGDQDHPEIRLGRRIKGGETVFFVRDTGIGIEPSQHEKVFELFYKVDRKSEGRGAGLAIVKRIIEVHGGRIWIESEKGRGCTVCFTLPVVNSH